MLIQSICGLSTRLAQARSAESSRWGRSIRLTALAAIVGSSVLSQADATAQVVRTKKPDRGVYQAPVVDPNAPTAGASDASQFAELVRGKPTSINTSGSKSSTTRSTNPTASTNPGGQPRGGPLVDAAMDELAPAVQPSRPAALRPAPKITAVDASVPVEPNDAGAVGQVDWQEPHVIWDDHHAGDVMVAPEHYGEHAMDHGMGGCDSCGCGGYGCDSMGCDGCDACSARSTCGRLSNARLSFCRDQWFGSVELMLMFRDGDLIPRLVTTGPAATPTQTTLVGGQKIFDDLAAGGRVTLGTWLDAEHYRSLVMRGWFGGEVDYDFARNSNQTPVLARPFTVANVQNSEVVASPGVSGPGSINVEADSSVYGADVSVRQFWFGGLGATVDVLYGYQYMGLSESLEISSRSVAINLPPTPAGTIRSVRDSFEADNQFHGGQFGLATRYREGCWTFDGLIKTGFGSLARTAERRGTTNTFVAPGNEATTQEGLLVRASNRGETTDHTFGWVPELDFTLGWHRYPRFDVTVGYNLVVMTDALSVLTMVDTQVDAVAGRPAAVANYETFFVHGIHFGLQYHY